jgi:hypothetical protein
MNGILTGISTFGRDLAVKDVNLRLWQGFVLTFPLYILPSGGPQLSNMFVVAILIRMLATGHVQLDRRCRFILKSCFLFVAYAFLVNSYWSLKFFTSQYIIVGPFYIYNMITLWVAFALYTQHRERFIQFTLKAMMITIAYHIPAALYFMRSGAFRATVFFNNPNQLGFFGLLAAAITIYCSRAVKVSPYLVGLTLVGILFLTLISLSKAAMGGVVLMLLIYGLTQPKVGITFALLVSILFTATPIGSSVFQKAFSRVDTVGQSDDSAEGRGYDRILNYPHHLALGAGEGGYERFNRYGGKEIHSVFGTLIFCYGLVGSVLVYFFIYQSCRGLGWHIWPLLPVAFYGVTHQGLRFSMLWVVLAIAWCCQDAIRRRSIAASPTPELPSGAVLA